MTDQEFLEKVRECLIAVNGFWKEKKSLKSIDYIAIGKIALGLNILNNPADYQRETK